MCPPDSTEYTHEQLLIQGLQLNLLYYKKLLESEVAVRDIRIKELQKALARSQNNPDSSHLKKSRAIAPATKGQLQQGPLISSSPLDVLVNIAAQQQASEVQEPSCSG